MLGRACKSAQSRQSLPRFHMQIKGVDEGSDTQFPLDSCARMLYEPLYRHTICTNMSLAD